MKITKKSGDIVDFNRGKLMRSLLRSGASQADAEQIRQAVEAQLHDGMSTRQIYGLVHKMLKKISAPHAARYNLKTAIQQLGPAGFFFEKFVALLFSEEGYQVKLNLILQGRCVTHEVDAVIRKSGLLAMVECKFHAHSAAVSDVKIPMYILSRFNDLKSSPHQVFEIEEILSGCRIVTNNRFSADAVTFGHCSGLDLLSWDYPPEDCLKTKIDSAALYPLTCLSSFSAIEKEKLMISGIILAKDLMGASEVLHAIGISENRRKNILNEAAGLCQYLKS